MRAWIGSAAISRFAGVVATFWLCGAGSAWAGGGMDLGGLQGLLNGVCPLLGMTTCPQLPTVTQAVLQIVALENTQPDLLRADPSVAKICTVSGLPLNPGPNEIRVPPCEAVAINAVNPAAASSVTLSDLTPVGFISPATGQGPAVAAPPGTSGTNAFLYAVATGANGQPNELHLWYDYLPATQSTFTSATISIPLEVVNKDGSESLASTTLTITAACVSNNSCNATGVFPGTTTAQTFKISDLGLTTGLVFGASPNSGNSHAIIDIQVPLLVTGPAKPAKCGTAITNVVSDPTDCGNDPAYFGVVPEGATLDGTTPNPNVGSPTGVNQLSGLPTAFTSNATGFPAAVLKGAAVGIAPSAAPYCPGVPGTPCPPPPLPFQPTVPFCASFSVSNAFRPAVAAFYVMGTDGTIYLSSSDQTKTGTPARCPF